MIKAVLRSRYALRVLARLSLWRLHPYKGLPQWYVDEMAQLHMPDGERLDTLALLAREEISLRVIAPESLKKIA